MYILRYDGKVAAVVRRDNGQYIYSFSSIEEANLAISHAERIAVQYPPENRPMQEESITPSVKQGLRIFLSNSFPVD